MGFIDEIIKLRGIGLSYCSWEQPNSGWWQSENSNITIKKDNIKWCNQYKSDEIKNIVDYINNQEELIVMQGVSCLTQHEITHKWKEPKVFACRLICDAYGNKKKAAYIDWENQNSRYNNRADWDKHGVYIPIDIGDYIIKEINPREVWVDKYSIQHTFDYTILIIQRVIGKQASNVGLVPMFIYIGSTLPDMVGELSSVVREANERVYGHKVGEPYCIY